MEAGLTAKFRNTEAIVKQMRQAAHMALTCGTTFTDTLGKMVERKHVIALYTMRCFAEKQPLAHMQLHGLAEENSTGFPEVGKGARRWGILVVSLWSS